MYTYLTIILLVLVFSIYVPALKKIRKRNKELVGLVQTLIITAIGIFLGMQFSIFKLEQDEKHQLVKQINAVHHEAEELLNNMQNFKVSISKINIDSSQVYKKFFKDNHLPRSYLLPNLIDNELTAKYFSTGFFRASPQIQRNFYALQHNSQSDMSYENAYAIVYGYIHQIESLIEYLEIEKEFIKDKINGQEARKKYNNSILIEMKKNQKIQKLIKNTMQKNYYYNY